MSRLEQKLEEIRSKPEHVRIWYVYGAVAICMIFVLLIFYLNIKINFSGTSAPVEDNTDPFSIIKDEVGGSLAGEEGEPSLSDVLDATREAQEQIETQAEAAVRENDQDRDASGIANDPLEAERDGRVGPTDDNSLGDRARDINTFPTE